MSNPYMQPEIKRAKIPGRLTVLREAKMRMMEECLKQGLDPKIVTIYRYHDIMKFDPIDFFVYMRQKEMKFCAEVTNIESAPQQTASTTED